MPANIDRPGWDWQWKLVGNETEAERVTLDRMLAAARTFVTAIREDRTPYCLSFLGGPGCGKTHLADRIRCYLRAYGEHLYNTHEIPRVDPRRSNYRAAYAYAQEGAILTKWGTLLEKTRAGDFRLFHNASHDHYKVLDDLGVDSFGHDGLATAFAVQKMSEILDRRLRKWTVVTSNFSRSQLATQFDPRISSRLMRGDSVIVDCSGVRDFGIRKEGREKEELGEQN